MKILVTGGAGYIGSFMVKRLLAENAQVYIADSLERGHKEAVDSRAVFVHGNLTDKSFVETIFEKNTFDGVIHFAGFISMGESMENPYLYFHNNVAASLNIMEAMVKHGSNNLIFSSTAGVYGMPRTIPIPEDHETHPENPYGESKRVVEQMLYWYNNTQNLSYCALRYFNAAGAALDASLGENHDPESHIIPNAMHALLSNSSFTLFGTDYDTPDGTCVRDYIHVIDLVEAHVLALQKLFKDKGGYTYNVGTGRGHSNKEVLSAIEKFSGKNITIINGQRRPGDANMLVADATAIQKDLGFSPKYSDLETIVETAWKWHSK